MVYSLKTFQSNHRSQNDAEPIKIAIAGLGHQGQKHLAASLNLVQKGIVELTALCDANPGTWQTLSNQIPCYSTYEEMAEKEKFDVLILALPHTLHTSVAKDALERNIHVLKEKPFALTFNEASELLKLAKLKGCHLKVAQQRIFHPFYSKAKEFIKGLGRIRYLDYSFVLNDNSDSWYWSKAQGGGCWHGLGWHGCWILSFFLGLPQIVHLQCISGKRRTTPYDTDDTAFLTCTYDRGTIGRLFLSVCCPNKKEEVFVEGETGSFQLNRNSLRLFDENGKELRTDNTQYDWNLAYERQIESFVSEVRVGNSIVDKTSWEAMLMHDAGLQSSNYQLLGFEVTPNFIAS